MEIEPIGVVHNTVTEGIDHDWGSVVSEIVLQPDFARGLSGLDDFSHAMVVFLMHQSQFDAVSHLVRRPQDRADMPLLGIFAQRAKHRPNPIGVTTVQIVQVAVDSITVRGLDAINGTPVLDIKPHFPLFDSPVDTVTPEWVDRLMQRYF